MLTNIEKEICSSAATILCCGGGQVVCMLAFPSNDPSSNPTEVHTSYCVKIGSKDENMQKEAGNDTFKKRNKAYTFVKANKCVFRTVEKALTLSYFLSTAGGAGGGLHFSQMTILTEL